MTVAALPAVAEYLEDGVSTAFPVPFRFKTASDLMVTRIVDGVELGLVAGVDYSVAGGSTDAGGTVTRTVASIGAVLRIVRATARAQPMVYTTGDRFPAISHEEALDRQMLIAQEQDAAQADTTARAIMLPPGERATDLPPASLRAGGNKVLGPDRITGEIVVLDGTAFQGRPGGNAAAIGLFTAASSFAIPDGYDLVQTSGFAQVGFGAARYAYDPAVTAIVVAANPFTTFVDKVGRGFRLVDAVGAEALGAAGDRFTGIGAPIAAPNDAAGLQRMLTAASGNGRRMGEARLRDKSRYRIDDPLRLDAIAVSMAGFATIDATRMGAKAAIVVDSTPASEFINSYGYKGRIVGNVRLYGARAAGSIGLDFNSQQNGGAAQLDTQGMVVARFATGIALTERAYNSTFYRLEIFECDIGMHWKAGGADNGERNTLLSPTLYNLGRALVNEEPSSSLVSYGGSIDYTTTVAEALRGKVFLTDMHLESSVWGEYPFRAVGDGAFLVVKGGFVLHATSAIRPYPYLAYVNAGGRMDIDGAVIHNINLRREGPDIPTAFFNGDGMGVIRDTHGFNGGRLPDRLHAQYTSLADPSFEEDGWRDLKCPTAGGVIADRETATNLKLTKGVTTPRSGTKYLRAQKIGVGAGAEASFMPMCMRVRHPDKVLAGFHYRLESGPAQNFQVQWFWGKLDRFDATGLPIWFKTADALRGFNNGLGEALTADGMYRMHVFGKQPGEPTEADSKNRIDLGARYAPTWADHIFPVVRMFDMVQDSVLCIDDCWSDRW